MTKQKPAESYRKPCTLCHTPRDVLVRCQVDPSTTTIPASSYSSNPSTSNNCNENENEQPVLKPNAWHFVCPGSCWKRVSGGVIDGDLKEGREGYRLKGKLGRDGGGGGGGGGGEGEDGKEGSEGSEEGEGDEA
ncbi:hypothetical protein MBLNU13_g04954t1 [Cladosporium sp. NU13]